MKKRTYIQPLIELHNTLMESILAGTEGDGHGGGDPVRPPGWDDANEGSWDEDESMNYRNSLWD